MIIPKSDFNYVQFWGYDYASRKFTLIFSKKIPEHDLKEDTDIDYACPDFGCVYTHEEFQAVPLNQSN